MNKKITLALLFFIFVSFSNITKASIPTFAGAERDGAVQFVIEDTVYIGLGYNETGALNDFWKYSKSTGIWERIADFGGIARTDAVAFTLNGIGYVGLGREDYSSSPFRDFYSYDPNTNQWAKATEDFGGDARYSAVSFTIGNIAYVGTGAGDTGDYSDFWEFDGSSWTEVTATFSGDKRRSASAFVIDGKAYLSGGFYFDSYSVQLSDIQQYDPTTNTWTEKIFADGNNLSINDAATIVYNGEGYFCYGNKSNIVKYNPVTNEVENLGDSLGLGNVRNNPIGFSLGGIPYFGLGSYTDESFNSVYNKDILSLIETYIISFDGNGNDDGNPPVSIENTSGSVINLPEGGNLSKTGYKFIGWNTQPNSNGAHYNPGNEYTLSKNATLYAEWIEENDYLISQQGIIVTDSGYFYDSGWKDYGYNYYFNDREYYRITFYPETVDSALQFIFEEFDVNGGHETEGWSYWGSYLHIFNGTSTNDPKFSTYDPLFTTYWKANSYFNNSNIPDTITAANADGAVTFYFRSDPYRKGDGWKAKIKLVPKYDVAFNVHSIDSNIETFTISLGPSINSIKIKNGTDTLKLPKGKYPYSITTVGYEKYVDTLIVNNSDHIEDIQLTPVIDSAYLFTQEDLVITDGGYFYDSGGPDSNYGKYEGQKEIVFYPKTKGNKLRFIFEEIDIYGSLYVYDGAEIESDNIITYYNNSPVTNDTITSTNEEGAIRFRFWPGWDNSDPGWKARILSVLIHDVGFSSIGKGDIEGILSQAVEDGLSTSAVTAVPNTGYEFLGWYNSNDELISLENPLIIEEVNSDITLFALFDFNYKIFDSENFSVSSKSPTCYNFSDGQINIRSDLIDVDVYVHELDRTYSVSAGKNYIIQDLASGIYHLNVAVGDQERKFVVDIEAISEINSSVLVEGKSVQFNIEGGTSPYNVQIGNASYVTETGRLTVNHLHSGAHTAIIKDENNCTKDLILEFSTDNLRIYPNPVENNEITIFINDAYGDDSYEISIINNDGKVLLKELHNRKNITLDISKLQSGLYFLIVQGVNYKETEKIIVK